MSFLLLLIANQNSVHTGVQYVCSTVVLRYELKAEQTTDKGAESGSSSSQGRQPARYRLRIGIFIRVSVFTFARYPNLPSTYSVFGLLCGRPESIRVCPICRMCGSTCAYVHLVHTFVCSRVGSMCPVPQLLCYYSFYHNIHSKIYYNPKNLLNSCSASKKYML